MTAAEALRASGARCVVPTGETPARTASHTPDGPAGWAQPSVSYRADASPRVRYHQHLLEHQNETEEDMQFKGIPWCWLVYNSIASGLPPSL